MSKIRKDIFDLENRSWPSFCCKSCIRVCAFTIKEKIIVCDYKFFIADRYQKLMRESSRMPLFDLRKLNASLPVPSVQDPSLQILVLGANDDFIVDAKGVGETGMFYGVQPVCIKGVAHDIMLDISWEKGAELILSWLKALKREDTN